MLIDQIIEEAKAAVNIDNKIILNEAKSHPSYIGIIRNNGTWPDVKRCRRFYEPSALYSHQHGPNIAVIAQLRSTGNDLHVTDNEGLVSNSINSDSTLERLTEAYENQKKIIYMFGGSTMFGMGSRLPQFTLPSLTEKILNEVYGIPSICVNFGLGGTSCTEAFNVLIHKALQLGKPTDIVFYDGWNCASYLPLQFLLGDLKEFKHLIHPGEILRHLEHNILIANSFNTKYIFKRLLNLFFHKLMVNDFSERIVNKIDRKRFLERLVNKLFPLRTKDMKDLLISEANLRGDINKANKKALTKFESIHQHVASISNSMGIRYHHFLQPLVFNGNKQLTKNESIFKQTGFSSGGDSNHFKKFYKLISESCLPSYSWFEDLSSAFDSTTEEVYIDSGHLNPLGNAIVSQEIVKKIASTMHVK